MAILNIGPQWFQGYDILFNIVFAVVTLFIAILSYKAKMVTKEKKYSFFGSAFLLIAIAHLIFVVFALLRDYVGFLIEPFDFIFLIHILLMLLAYTILLIVILKIENKKITSLIFALILLMVLFSYQYFIKFHIISFVLLVFLTWQFFRNYQNKRNINTKFVYVSFFLLACSHIFFAAIQTSVALYVAGEVLQLIGFILLFFMLMRLVLYNGRKKRKA